MRAFHNSLGELRLILDVEGEDLSPLTEVDLPVDYDARCWEWSTEALEFVRDFTTFDAGLHTRIDREAGEFRRRFITDVPGQEAVYMAKEAEATSWSAASLPGSAPYLEAEAHARGIGIDAMVTMIRRISSEWKALSVAIEAKRIAAKEAVTAADTIEAKDAAATVNWEALLT